MLKTLKASRAPPAGWATRSPRCPRLALQKTPEQLCRCWYLPVLMLWGGGASMSKGSIPLPFAVVRAGPFIIPLMEPNK